MEMDNKLKDKLVKCLKTLKAEKEKRNEICKHGVDLVNYEKKYLSELEGLISFCIGGTDTEDTISWWLYEDVDKIIYFADGTKRDIKKVEDLLEYLIECKDNAL